MPALSFGQSEPDPYCISLAFLQNLFLRSSLTTRINSSVIKLTTEKKKLKNKLVKEEINSNDITPQHTWASCN